MIKQKFDVKLAVEDIDIILELIDWIYKPNQSDVKYSDKKARALNLYKYLMWTKNEIKRGQGGC
ncbi:hypothetical protein [Anaerococcus porci]|nr:hypothetical protein [Anaerococcus porci]